MKLSNQRLAPWRAMCIVFLCLAVRSPALADGDSTKRPLTMADSIAMNRLIGLDSMFSTVPENAFRLSPDGRRFFIVTRKGDVQSGLNHFQLVLYDVHDVLAFVNDGDRLDLPKGRVLDTISTRSEGFMMRQFAIRNVRWSPDGDSIFYIGDNGKDPGQIYRLNINTGKREQITNHVQTVFLYDFDQKARTLIFAAPVSDVDKAGQRTSFAVGLRSITELANINRGHLFIRNYQYYHVRIGEKRPARAIGPLFVEKWVPRGAWLSPNGEKLVLRTAYQSPERQIYEIYRPFNESEYYRGLFESYDSETDKPIQRIIDRLVMMDVKTGAVDDVLNGAPAASDFAGEGVILWRSDSEEVVFPPTFLPKADSEAEEWRRRREQASLVSYNVREKHLSPVHHFSMLELREQNENRGYAIRQAVLSVQKMALDENGVLYIHYRNNSDGTFRIKSYRKSEDNWVEVDAPSLWEPAKTRLQLSIRQALNMPPDILAVDTETGNERVISDLNPQFRDLTFGEAKPFEWQDAEGRTWPGGLVFPPNYQPGKKYPLVIQTKPFQPRKFLMDGPYDFSVFAAQALANKDMLVLQMPQTIRRAVNPEVFAASMGRQAELDIHRQGVEGAIDTLDSLGLIDRSKVGMVGFSHSCLYVDTMIAFSDYKLAAAIRTDGIALGHSAYFNRFGRAGSGMAYLERFAESDRGDVTGFLTSPNLPTLHLENVETPLRAELYLNGQNYSGDYWDLYTLLKRLGKPVEFILYPNAHHVNISPAARLDSAGGAVDWFAFWLKGEEDSDPAKAELYQRWHAMRDKQCERLNGDDSPSYCRQ